MSIPENLLRELPFLWRFRPGPQTDPIDMEFVLQDLDPGLRTKVLAAQLDAVAKVQGNIADIHRNIAEGAQNISKILRAGK
jgi:hypothetical protein